VLLAVVGGFVPQLRLGESTDEKPVATSPNTASETKASSTTNMVGNDTRSGRTTASDIGALSDAQDHAIRLFGGETFDGWELDEGCKFRLNDAVSIQPDGVLRVHHKPEMKRNDSVLWYESEFDDFRLRLQWQQLDKTKEVGKGTGILVRANELDTGIEVGIGSVVATGAFFVPKSCHLDTPPEKASPHVSEMRWAKKYTSRPIGEWNDMIIICEGDTITVECNGVMVNRGENCSERSGRIGILLQGSEYEFRNIYLTPHSESEN